MNCPKYKLNIKTDSIAGQYLSSLLSINNVKFGLAALTLTFTTATMAEWNDNPSTETAYVDSIHQWGAWELDIEPAAGGITPAATQALNTRNPKVSLRINSIAALAPVAGATAPVPPVAIPPAPPITPPVAPPAIPHIPPRVGGPTNRLF